MDKQSSDFLPGSNSINRFFSNLTRKIYGGRHHHYNKKRHKYISTEKKDTISVDVIDKLLEESSFAKTAKTQQQKHHHRKTKQKPIWKRIFVKHTKKTTPKPVFAFTKAEEEAKKQDTINYGKYATISANSIFIFIIAYITVYLTYQFAVIFTASLFRIDAVLYYFEVLFPIGNSSTLWSPLNIIAITLSGPLACLIAGIIYYRFLLYNKKITDNIKLFGFWLTVLSFALFFGAFVSGIITGQGFGYVADWMFFNTFIRILLSLILLFILVVIGYYLSRYFFETSPQPLRSKNRIAFYLSQGILPLLICIPLLYTIKIPYKTPQHENILDYDMVALCSVLFSVIPVFFNRNAKPRNLPGKESRKKRNISVKYLLIMLLLLIAYRIGLIWGLHFVIRLHFAVSIY